MYYEAINEQKFGSITPVIYGYQNCESGHFYGPAVRSYYLFHYIMSGKGIFKSEGKTHNCREGDMFIIKPSVLTYYEADEGDPWEYVWIGFTAEELPAELPPVAHLPTGKAIFSEIKNARNMSSGKEALLISKIWEILSYLSVKEKAEVSAVSRALSVFNFMYSSPITVTEVAEMLHAERTHFSYAFKKEVGVSPKEYLMTLRMEKAKELLKSGQCNPSAAAFSVGYRDLFTFSRAYKKYFGVSPREHKGK